MSRRGRLPRSRRRAGRRDLLSATGEREAPLAPEDVRLLPGVRAGAARLCSGPASLLVVISNQADVCQAARRRCARCGWHMSVSGAAGAEGVPLDGAYYSYGHPDGTFRISAAVAERKPSPCQLLRGRRAARPRLRRSLDGRRPLDATSMRAGAAGCRTIRTRWHDGSAPTQADLVTSNLREPPGMLLRRLCLTLAGSVADGPPLRNGATRAFLTAREQ